MIPTYNEADNITLLLRRLTELYRDPNIWWLRLTTHRTFIKFSLTGLSGVFVNLGSFHLVTCQPPLPHRAGPECRAVPDPAAAACGSLLPRTLLPEIEKSHKFF